MFRTIFSKMIAIFILVILLGYSITAVLLYFFLDNFLAEEKVKALEESSEKISESFSTFFENRNSAIALFFFERTLELYSSYTNSYIWIVTKNGVVWFSKPNMPKQIIQKYADENGRIKLPDERQYKKVMSGTETIKEIGDFYGFFKDEVFIKNGLGDSWLTVAKPFILEYEDSNQQTVAAVMMHTPVPEIQKARQTFFKFFEISVGIAIVISAFLAYVFSLKITNPLKQISNTARIIASGEFNKRLNISSNDEIGELARSFNQMVAALQNLEEMRRGFIANVSHELRTPMTTISGFIEGILDETIPPEKHREYLTIVRDETKRLNRLVNDMLDLAKMEAGEMTLTIKDFDINELARRCIIKLESFIVKKNIEVEADFEEEEVVVRADSDAIERVLYNLIHNAIKFTPENGRIVVKIETRKDKVLVSVEDNGIGIENDEISMIWDRFYKSDKSRSRDKSAAGLGLAIVKGIINEHHEEIWVESEPGKGTKFTFSLKKA